MQENATLSLPILHLGLDGAGNWNYHNSYLNQGGSQTDNKSFTANEFNAYTQAGGASMTYDLNGNLTQNGQRNQALQWDAFNRLVSVIDATTQTVSFLYDAAGRRVRKSVLPVTVYSTGMQYGLSDHTPLVPDDEWLGYGWCPMNVEFGSFTIPTDATITGVEVTVRQRGYPYYQPTDDFVALSIANQTSLDYHRTEAWDGSDQTVVYGSPSDAWGLALTPAILNDNGLYMEYSVNGGQQEYEFVAVNVYYLAAQGAETTVYDWSYDGNQIVEEKINGSSGPKKQWVYGRYIDEPLVMDVDAGSGGSCIDFGAGDKRYFYHQNLNYSVVGLTDSNGVLVEANEYTPYGQFITLSHGGGAVLFDGTDTITANGASPLGNPYMFTGRQFDPETGMQYNRARYYDALLGRFISRDPVGYEDNVNLYSYVNNSPVTNVDPLGLWHSGTHEELTIEAYPSDNLILKDYILDRLIKGNNKQDSNPAFFNDLKRHFNRHKKEDRGNMVRAYINYLKTETDTYNNLMSSPSKKNCKAALKSLGLRTHSWQDFYAHSVMAGISDGDFWVPLWTSNPKRVGSPDNPGELTPSSWENWHNTGTHGWFEPYGEEGALRKKDAVDFVKEKYSTIIPEYIKKCYCYLTKYL